MSSNFSVSLGIPEPTQVMPPMRMQRVFPAVASADYTIFVIGTVSLVLPNIAWNLIQYHFRRVKPRKGHFFLRALQRSVQRVDLASRTPCSHPRQRCCFTKSNPVCGGWQDREWHWKPSMGITSWKKTIYLFSYVMHFQTRKIDLRGTLQFVGDVTPHVVLSNTSRCRCTKWSSVCCWRSRYGANSIQGITSTSS